eukprot:GEMP01048474.1.p1 GENE.GEMP01048474.1~~GEMP01048474.1.p1  ORF type:complete len:351 (+),score=47.11 GEMP01048474.1:46-1053(+)
MTDRVIRRVSSDAWSRPPASRASLCSDVDELVGSDSEQADQDTAVNDQDSNVNDESDIDSGSVSYVSEVRDEIIFESEWDLAGALRQSGVDIGAFGGRMSKTLKDLYWETCKRECKLQWVDGQLQRRAKVLKIFLHSETLSGHKVLMGRSQQIGTQRRVFPNSRRPVMKKLFFGEDEDEVSYQVDALRNLCGMQEEVQKQHIKFMYRTEYEEGPCSSFGYPGLVTHYEVIERHLVIKDFLGDGLEYIGLPSGVNFSHMELCVPTCRRHYWTWQDDTEVSRIDGLSDVRPQRDEVIPIGDASRAPLATQRPDDDAHRNPKKRSFSVLSCCLAPEYQ